MLAVVAVVVVEEEARDDVGNVAEKVVTDEDAGEEVKASGEVWPAAMDSPAV